MDGELANAYRNFNHTCREYRRQLETEPMDDFTQLEAEVCELYDENQRLIAEIQRLKVEIQRPRAEFERLEAENDAVWAAVADLGGYLTPEQIHAELVRQGIDTTRAFDRLRAALRARKGG